MPRRILLVKRTVGTMVLSSRKAAQSRYELGSLFVVDAEREKKELDSLSWSSLLDSELHGGHRIAAHALALVGFRMEGRAGEPRVVG